MAKNPNPYIEIDREFQYDPLFLNPKYINHLRLYLYLRMNTAHKQEVLRDVTIEQGQLVRSISQMAKGIGLKYEGKNGKPLDRDVDQIRDSLEFLEQHNYIAIQRRNHKPSIITVFADKRHSLEAPTFLENTGNSDSMIDTKRHSLEADTVKDTKKDIVKRHSLESTEVLENTGNSDDSADAKRHSKKTLYENSILFKRNGIKEYNPAAENVDNSGENQKVSTSDPEKSKATAPETVTLTPEKVRSITKDPFGQLKLLEMLEAHNNEPLTVRKDVIEQILKGLHNGNNRKAEGSD